MFGDTPPARIKASGLCLVATRGLEYENNLLEVMAWNSFPVADFDL